MAPSPGNSKLFVRAGLLLAGLAWTVPFLQPYHRYPLTSFYSQWIVFAKFERSWLVYPGEAAEVAAQLEILARDRPEVFMPLLELSRASGSSRAVKP